MGWGWFTHGSCTKSQHVNLSNEINEKKSESLLLNCSWRDQVSTARKGKQHVKTNMN